MADYAGRYLTGGFAKRDDFLDQLALGGPARQLEQPAPVHAALAALPVCGRRAVRRRDRHLGAGERRSARQGPGLDRADPASGEVPGGRAAAAGGAGRSPGPGWKRAAHGTIGEFDTAELMRTSDSPLRAARAADGLGRRPLRPVAAGREERARPRLALGYAPRRGGVRARAAALRRDARPRRGAREDRHRARPSGSTIGPAE